MRPVKVVITNIVSLNTGDAAILWGMLEIIKSKYGSDVDVIVFDRSADVAQRYYPWATFRQSLLWRPYTSLLSKTLESWGYGHWNRRLRFARYVIAIQILNKSLPRLSRLLVSADEARSLQCYAEADLILSTGGTYLIENYDLAVPIHDYKISLATNARFGFFTQSLGPFTTRRNIKAFSKIFQSAAVILLRDERSKRHLVQIGVREQAVNLAADAAFLLAESGQNLNRGKERNSGWKIAISVRSMKHFFEGDQGESDIYFAALIEVISFAISKYDASITFLSTCQGIPEYWTNDADVATKICARLPANLVSKVVVDREFRQPKELVEVFGEFDVVIATRMHAAILSMCAGTPVLGLAYEFKMEELFGNVGMPELVQSIGGLNPERLCDALTRLIDRWPDYAAKTKASGLAMAEQAQQAQQALPELN